MNHQISVSAGLRTAIEFGKNMPIPLDADMARNLLVATSASAGISLLGLVVDPYTLSYGMSYSDFYFMPFTVDWVNGLLDLLAWCHPFLMVTNVISFIAHVALAIRSEGWSAAVPETWHWVGLVAMAPPALATLLIGLAAGLWLTVTAVHLVLWILGMLLGCAFGVAVLAGAANS